MKRTFQFTVSFAVGMVVMSGSFAASGDKDPTFGTGGRVVTDLGTSESAAGVALAGDGAIVVGGSSYTYDSTTGSSDTDFAIARYSPTGVLQSWAITDLGASDYATDVAVDPSGRAVVVGSSGSSIAIVRYNADSTLDETFGTGGKVTTSVGTVIARMSDVVIEPDGKLLLVGQLITDTFSYAGTWLLARFNSDGSADSSFGAGGLVITDLGSDYESAQAVALLQRGKILVAGYSAQNAALVRYNSDGTLDATWGTAGVVRTTFGYQYASASSIVIQNGLPVVSGFVDDTAGENGQQLLARFRRDGSIDRRFGNNGITTIDMGTSVEHLHQIALDSVNRIVGIASLGDGPVTNVLHRFTKNGGLDQAFGSGGSYVAPSDDSIYYWGLAVQPDAKPVVVGDEVSSNGDIFVDRFLPGKLHGNRG